jgi:hypothetical protein
VPPPSAALRPSPSSPCLTNQISPALWPHGEVRRISPQPADSLNPYLEINLSELQKTLDAQGIEVVDFQKESVIGRKALADKTKGAAVVGVHTMSVLMDYPRIQEDS